MKPENENPSNADRMLGAVFGLWLSVACLVVIGGTLRFCFGVSIAPASPLFPPIIIAGSCFGWLCAGRIFHWMDQS